MQVLPFNEVSKKNIYVSKKLCPARSFCISLHSEALNVVWDISSQSLPLILENRNINKFVCISIDISYFKCQV